MTRFGTDGLAAVVRRLRRCLGVAGLSLMCAVVGLGQPQDVSVEIAEQAEAAFSGDAVMGAEPGEVRVNPQDNQRYVWVPPGFYQQGCVPGDTECLGHERPRKITQISRGLWFRETEVTVGEFEAYAARKNLTMPWSPGFIPTLIPLLPPVAKGFNYKWEDKQQPMLMVTWQQADAYCREQAGGRLPTEAEWEYAARGGEQDLRYGDRDELQRSDANYGAETCCKPATEGDDVYEFAAPVKQFPPNAYGLYDVLGNAWEWTQDWYQPNAYESEDEKDPRGPGEGKQRVLRGGGYDNAPRQLRVSERHSAVPGIGTAHFGFRCVHLDLSSAAPAP